MLDGRHTGTGGGNHIVHGRRHAGRQPVPAPPRPAAQPARLLAQPPGAVLPVLGAVHRRRPARRRASDEARTETTLRAARSPSTRSPTTAQRTCRRGWSTASCATCWSTSPATPTAPSSASTSCTSPDSATGRLGLLELRAFEMPPHARMSLAQQLLLRAPGRAVLEAALPAAAWRAGARSCTTASCCRTSSEQDFDDVLADLGEAGYRFEPEWFAPHVEFRFPRYGEFTHRGIHFELRSALEPWHVLGEEAAAGGTARYVDSSLERMQVKVPGMTGDAPHRRLQRRAACRCTRPAPRRVRGRRALPRLAAAVVPAPDHRRRTRRWSSTWSTPGTSRSVGGCTYHVDASGRAQLRHVPGQRQRGRGAPPRALQHEPALAGLVRLPPPGHRHRAGAERGVPLHARSAPDPGLSHGERTAAAR